MLGQLFQSFTQAPQGQQAIQQLSAQGFAPNQSMGFLQSAFPAAASAFQRARGGAAGPQGVTDVGSSHYVTNFLSAAVTGLIRGEGIVGAAVDGLQGVVGGHVAQVIATRFGLPQRVAGTIGAIVTPLMIDFLWEKVQGGLDLGSLLGVGGLAAGGAALGAAALSSVGGGGAPAAGFGTQAAGLGAAGGLAGMAGAAAQALGLGGAAPGAMPASGFGVPAPGATAGLQPGGMPATGFGVPAPGMGAPAMGGALAGAGMGATGAAGAQPMGLAGAAASTGLAGLGSMLPGGIPALGAISAAVGTPGAAASPLGALGGMFANLVMPPTQGSVGSAMSQGMQAQGAAPGKPMAPAKGMAQPGVAPNAATTPMPDIGSIFRMFGGS